MLIQDLRSRVCYLVDSDLTEGDVGGAVRRGLKAGVGMVLYRSRARGARHAIEDVARLVRVTRLAGVPLLIDGRVDVALSIGADGVHLGAEDVPVGYARRLMGPAAIVGAAVAGPGDVRTAEEDGATYVLACGVGGVSEALRTPDARAIAQVSAAGALPVCVPLGTDGTGLTEVGQAGAQLILIEARPGDEPSVRGFVSLVARDFRPHHVAP